MRGHVDASAMRASAGSLYAQRSVCVYVLCVCVYLVVRDAGPMCAELQLTDRPRERERESVRGEAE